MARKRPSLPPIMAEWALAPIPAARCSPRKPVAFGAQLRQTGCLASPVEVLDLSPEGFQVAFHWPYKPGTRIWLRLPGIESQCATVIWSDGKRLGCKFDTPLHVLVMEHLVAHAR